MRRFLSCVVILWMSFDISIVAYVATERTNQQVAQLRTQIDGLSQQAVLTEMLNDHRAIEGKLLLQDDESVALATPDKVEVRYIEIKAMSAYPQSQSSPTKAHASPSHRHHHVVRNVLIGFAACFAFALIVAVASK